VAHGNANLKHLPAKRFRLFASKKLKISGAVFAPGATKCFGGTPVTPKDRLTTGIFLPHGDTSRSARMCGDACAKVVLDHVIFSQQVV
jgi:hypothetical protein